MGWKGAIRSIQAEARRAEKRRAQMARIQEAHNARNIVERYDEYCERLVTLHHDCSEDINWSEYIQAAEPVQPVQNSELETQARKRFEEYIPSFFIRWLGLSNWRRNSLESKIADARVLDIETFQSVSREYFEDHKQWWEGKQLAERVLAFDVTAFEQVVRKEETLHSIFGIGPKFYMRVRGKCLEVDVEVFGDEILPRTTFTLTKTGKLSQKDTPNSKFNAKYQDYVCSLMLRVCAEVFAMFPVESVCISAVNDMVSPQTGHKEMTPIVSARVARSVFRSLNLKSVDPSVAMENFDCVMDYKSQQGFRPIKKLSAA